MSAYVASVIGFLIGFGMGLWSGYLRGETRKSHAAGPGGKSIVNVHNYGGGSVDVDEGMSAEGLRQLDIYIRERAKAAARAPLMMRR